MFPLSGSCHSEEDAALFGQQRDRVHLVPPRQIQHPHLLREPGDHPQVGVQHGPADHHRLPHTGAAGGYPGLRHADPDGQVEADHEQQTSVGESGAEY